MTNATFTSIDDFRDIESLNHYSHAIAAGEEHEEVLAGLRTMSRDNARTPMQWDDSRHAGFTTGTPWIPVNPNHDKVNAHSELADPDSVLHHYRRLIQLRRDEPVVVHGDFTMLLPDHQQVYAFTRRLDGVELLVLGNFSGQQVTADVPDAATWARGEVLVTTCPLPVPTPLPETTPLPEPTQGTLVLEPWEARVYRRSSR